MNDNHKEIRTYKQTTLFDRVGPLVRLLTFYKEL